MHVSNLTLWLPRPSPFPQAPGDRKQELGRGAAKKFKVGTEVTPPWPPLAGIIQPRTPRVEGPLLDRQLNIPRQSGRLPSFPWNLHREEIIGYDAESEQWA
jgi:hypothetical protein